MNRRQLPIGIQDFQTIREANCYYVDKTALIHQLVNEGRSYFLSRPRRFGKSLLLDTIGSLFEGSEELFRGLAIHEQWDWSNQHPVVRLSFDAKYNEPGDVESSVHNQLAIIERNANVSLLPESLETGPGRLRGLLDALHRETGQKAVVLVDEYDKPILDVLEDPELAKANRDYLRGFYGEIKGSSRHVRFVFVTGISMFSKVSLFSGLNNLEDISLNPRYSAICGYTDNDIDELFAAELFELDREEIRRWYNGYSWRGEEKIYNPFDILLLFKSREFQPHWFETGSPTFLFQMLVDRKISPMSLENRIVEKTIVSKFDVEDITVDALLFQTGYMTIQDETWDGTQMQYTLGYPNFEVSWSLNHGLLNYVTRRGAEAANCGRDLVRLLAANEFDSFAEQLKWYLSGIPHQWYDVSEVERFESHYASMVYMAFRSIGIELRVEESSSHGRADMVVLHGEQVFVLEFKVVHDKRTADEVMSRAMKQLRERGYADKYRDRGEPIHLVAMAFGHTERNLLGIRAEIA